MILLNFDKTEIILSTECKSYGKTMKVDPEVEICAGRKLPKFSAKTFKRDTKGFVEVKAEVKETNDKNNFLLGKVVIHK